MYHTGTCGYWHSLFLLHLMLRDSDYASSLSNLVRMLLAPEDTLYAFAYRYSWR